MSINKLGKFYITTMCSLFLLLNGGCKKNTPTEDVGIYGPELAQDGSGADTTTQVEVVSDASGDGSGDASGEGSK